jgi:hypothetical protein
MPELARRSPWQVYGKSIAATAVLVVTAVQAALSDSVTGGRITQIEGVQIAVAFVNAGLVYLVPNVPQWPWAKTVLAAGLAVLQLAASLIVDGIGSADLSALILAALMVLAPAAAPSRSVTEPPPAPPGPPASPPGFTGYTGSGPDVYARDV